MYLPPQCASVTYIRTFVFWHACTHRRLGVQRSRCCIDLYTLIRGPWIDVRFRIFTFPVFVWRKFSSSMFMWCVRVCVSIIFISHVPLHAFFHVFLVNNVESEINPSQISPPPPSFQKGTGVNVQSLNSSTKHSLSCTANKSSISLRSLRILWKRLVHCSCSHQTALPYLEPNESITL